MSQLRACVARETQVFGVDALVMNDGTTHDDQGNPDTRAMVARCAVAAAIHGVPMVFMGEPFALADERMRPPRRSARDIYESGIYVRFSCPDGVQYSRLLGGIGPLG